LKRGGDDVRVPLDEWVAIVDPARADQWEALDAALDRLATLSARQARIVELRYFGGLTVEEAASVLDVSPNRQARLGRRSCLAPPRAGRLTRLRQSFGVASLLVHT
jgi:DNA-directed RNA polymerase specialized sigma24 family protein